MGKGISDYPSNGLGKYISIAKELLEQSRRGENPLEGWAKDGPPVLHRGKLLNREPARFGV